MHMVQLLIFPRARSMCWLWILLTNMRLKKKKNMIGEKNFHS
jgi:hypothetical protein